MLSFSSTRVVFKSPSTLWMLSFSSTRVVFKSPSTLWLLSFNSTRVEFRLCSTLPMSFFSSARVSDRPFSIRLPSRCSMPAISAAILSSDLALSAASLSLIRPSIMVCHTFLTTATLVPLTTIPSPRCWLTK